MKYIYLLIGISLTTIIVVLTMCVIGIFMYSEPFFTPLPWILIYIVFITIQLIVFLATTTGVLKLLNRHLNFNFTKLGYFSMGLIYSFLYIVSISLFKSKLRIFNNELFVIIMYPIIIYIITLFLVIQADRSKIKD